MDSSPLEDYSGAAIAGWDLSDSAVRCVSYSAATYIQPDGGFLKRNVYCLIRVAADIKVRAYLFLHHS
jgi:hypothetical protein